MKTARDVFFRVTNCPETAENAQKTQGGLASLDADAVRIADAAQHLHQDLVEELEGDP